MSTYKGHYEKQKDGAATVGMAMPKKSMSSHHAGRQRPEVLNEAQVANVTALSGRSGFPFGPFDS